MMKTAIAVAAIALGLAFANYAAIAQPAIDAGPAVTAPAHATPDSAPADWAKETYSAAQNGNWLLAAGLLCFGLVWLLRSGLGRFVPWFKGTMGGRVLALSVAFLVTLGEAMVAGQSWQWSMLGTALMAAWTASGAWHDVKDAMGAMKKA